MSENTPRVWVGCLGCYNAGNLVGEWYDAASFDESDWNPPASAEVRIEHERDGHEELWVFDHENFHGLIDGECSPSEARELAEALEASGNPAAFAAYVRNQGGLEYAEDFEEAFCGEWESEADYARELAEDLEGRGEFDRWPFTEIDWQHAWDELRMGGDYWSEPAPGGGFFIFRSA